MTGSRRTTTRAAGVALAIALAASGCRTMFQPPPQGSPTGRAGWLAYAVGDLRVEAPAAWRASGDPERLDLEAPDGSGRLQVRRVEQRYADETQCLAAVEQELDRSAEGLSRARTHPTTVGGRRAWVLEADQGGGHGWAWGICDGGTMYRAFLSGGAPLSKDVLDAYRTFLSSARFGGVA